MKQILILLFFFISFNFLAQNDPSFSLIIPTPYNFEDRYDGTKVQFDNLEIRELGSTKEEIAITKQWFEKSFPNRVKTTGKNLHIHFIRVQDANDARDQYELDLVYDTIYITHYSEAGKLYGISSLIQLIKEENNQLFITPFKLSDHANFQWRGQHLDVCRHFFTVDEVKRHIDLMAFYKFNKFHWHLTDDQAWRIEIKKYPRLTEIGAFRDSTLIGAYTTNPTNWDLTKQYGGFYTQEQIKDVVKYAQMRNVTIVPEIEMPGHARAALAAYPELGCTGKRPPLIGYWGVFDEIFCSNEKTISFLQDVLTEVLELFPSEYIHIGGDEAPKTQWKACTVCQQTIKTNNLKDEHELQSWFVHQMDDFLTKKGRKLLGWDEILEGGLSPNAAVMSWQGFAGGIAAAQQKHEVVMTPNDYCYFDYYQGNRALEPHSIGGLVTLEKVFNFNPIPSNLNTSYHKYIKGAQANLWTEYIKTYDHVQYMMYPRALAMIEAIWTAPKVKRSYEMFIQKLEDRQFDLLKCWNVNFATSYAQPQFEVTVSGLGILGEAHSNGDFSAVKLEYPTAQGSNDPFSSKSNSRFVVQRNKQLGKSTHTIKATELRYNITLDLNLTLHKGLGLKVDFITAPHPSYSLNAATKLVDGIIGQRPRLSNQWVGFNSKTTELVVHLDKEIKNKSITIGFLNEKGSWIYLPSEVRLIASKNGKKWKLLETRTVTGEQEKFNFKSKYKQLKLEIISLDAIPDNQPGAGTVPFTFMDELIIE